MTTPNYPTQSDPSAATADRVIVIERLFHAPRELVFRVFTEPNHVAQWWGPTGFTITTHEMDVRVGGVWRFTMHGPAGVDYPNKIRSLNPLTAPPAAHAN